MQAIGTILQPMGVMERHSAAYAVESGRRRKSGTANVFAKSRATGTATYCHGKCGSCTTAGDPVGNTQSPSLVH